MGRLGRRLRTRSLLVSRSFRPYGAVQSAWRGQKLRVFTRGNYRQIFRRRVLHVFPTTLGRKTTLRVRLRGQR